MAKSNSFAVKKLSFGLLALISLFSAELAVLEGTARLLNAGLLAWIPAILLVVGLAGIVNFLIDLLLSRRFNSAQSLMVALLIVLALVAVTFNFKENLVAYLLISLTVARFSLVVFDTSINNLSSSYVNNRLSKELNPYIHSMVDLAILVASAVVFGLAFFNVAYDPMWVLFVAIVVMVLLILVIDKTLEPMHSQVVEKNPIKRNLGESFNYVFKESKLFHQVAWISGLLGAVSVIFVYVYNDVFAGYFSGRELVQYFAAINMVAVLGRSLFDLFLMKGLVKRFGVANLILVYPWLMFLTVFGLLAFTRSLELASAMFIFHIFSYYSYLTFSTKAILGLAPKQITQEVYFIVKGIMPAAFTLLAAGAMWLLNIYFDNNSAVIVALMLILLGLSLIIGVRIKKQFQLQLLAALNSKDLSVKEVAIDLAGEKIQKEKAEQVLRSMLINDDLSPELRRRVLTSLVEIGNPNSIREILIIIEKENNIRLRFHALQAANLLLSRVNKKDWDNLTVTKLLMIETFNKVYEEDLPIAVKIEINNALKIFGFDVLLDFYKRHFANSIDLIKASIIEAMAVANDRGLITLLEPYLNSHDLGIKAAAIGGLWRFKEMRDRLSQEMVGVFSGKDSAHQVAALKMISQMQMKKMDSYVLDLIAVADDKVSSLAVITAINLGRKSAFKVLTRKLMKAMMLGNNDLIEYVFGKFYLFNKRNQDIFIRELRALNSPSFEMLRDAFNNSEKYFDLALTNLFTID